MLKLYDRPRIPVEDVIPVLSGGVLPAVPAALFSVTERELTS